MQNALLQIKNCIMNKNLPIRTPASQVQETLNLNRDQWKQFLVRSLYFASIKLGYHIDWSVQQHISFQTYSRLNLDTALAWEEMNEHVKVGAREELLKSCQDKNWGIEPALDWRLSHLYIGHKARKTKAENKKANMNDRSRNSLETTGSSASSAEIIAVEDLARTQPLFNSEASKPYYDPVRDLAWYLMNYSIEKMNCFFLRDIWCDIKLLI